MRNTSKRNTKKTLPPRWRSLAEVEALKLKTRDCHNISNGYIEDVKPETCRWNKRASPSATNTRRGQCSNNHQPIATTMKHASKTALCHPPRRSNPPRSHSTTARRKAGSAVPHLPKLAPRSTGTERLHAEGHRDGPERAPGLEYAIKRADRQTEAAKVRKKPDGSFTVTLSGPTWDRLEASGGVGERLLEISNRAIEASDFAEQFEALLNGRKAVNVRAVLSRKLAARLAELDACLDLDAGHGFAEAVMGESIADIMAGEHGLVLDGWNFEDPKGAASCLAFLARRWRKTPAAKAGEFVIEHVPGLPSRVAVLPASQGYQIALGTPAWRKLKRKGRGRAGAGIQELVRHALK